jgi:hypothetical protein
MRSFVYACSTVCLPLALAACAAGERIPPAEEPYLTGTITAVSGDPLAVRIEEIPGGLDTGGAKAIARVTDRTIVTRRGSAVAPGELRTGQRASLWLTGPVAESYPVQGEAGAIAILSDS